MSALPPIADIKPIPGKRSVIDPKRTLITREIYTTMTKDEKSRKAIIDEFMKQVGLSKAAANTYYQMIRKTA